MNIGIHKVIGKAVAASIIALSASGYCAYGEEKNTTGSTQVPDMKTYKCITMSEYNRLALDETEGPKFYLYAKDGKLNECKTDVGDVMKEMMQGEGNGECQEPNDRQGMHPGMQCQFIRQCGMRGQGFNQPGADAGMMRPDMPAFGKGMPMMMNRHDDKFVIISVEDYDSLKLAKLERIIGKMKERASAEDHKNSGIKGQEASLNGEKILISFDKPGRMAE